MISVVFFLFAVVIAAGRFFFMQEKSFSKFCNFLLGCILFFDVGLFSIFSAFGHIFMGPQIAQEIGWLPGSPFQFEVGVANLSYGVLGVLSSRALDRFSKAALLGWAIFLLGAFVGHMIQRYTAADRAMYNVGLFVWFNDFFLPFFALSLLFFARIYPRIASKEKS